MKSTDLLNRHTLLAASLTVLLACTAQQQDPLERKDDQVGAASTTLPSEVIEEELPASNDQPRADRKAKIERDMAGLAGRTREQASGAEQAQLLSPVASTPASNVATPGVPAEVRIATEKRDRENYAALETSPLKRVVDHPVSTFSIDVDTGAYANVRRFLNRGSLPPHDAVRAEEMINYFAYNYPVPDSEVPFSVVTELGPTPWNKQTRLLHIGIKGYELAREQLPAANIVFLIDVSGSMRAANKLELLKPAIKMLARNMTARDRIAVAVYAGSSGVALPPTAGDRQATIAAAIDSLSGGGSTNGAAGIRLAYSLAEQSFVPGGINRVVLATDGDFNVGVSDVERLKELVESKRKSGIALTTLGFGMGNYNDEMLEQLADVGNGNYAYIDNLNEARKVLVEELSATLMTIAKDVKIQVEFNPAEVAEYRLIGYVNRMLRREDFANDRIDAGEIGAGHTVTALYEIALTGSGGERISELRYGTRLTSTARYSNELAHLRLRYKAPSGGPSKLIERPVLRDTARDSLAATSEAYRFSAAVAGFAQILRGGDYTGDYGLADIYRLASAARSDDPFGYRGEFLQLVGIAESLSSGGAAIRQ